MNRISIALFLSLSMACLPVTARAESFSAHCRNGSVSAKSCSVFGGFIQAPGWWKLGSLWRVGEPLSVSFTVNDPLPNQLVLKVCHTGSWGGGEFTLGSVQVNGYTIVTGYVPPDHMNQADSFSIPRAYLRPGVNTVTFSLSGGDFVWWIRSIEAKW